MPATEALATLPTEARNPASENLDALPTLDMLRIINDEDAHVVTAVRAELPHIAQAIDRIAERFAHGGRLFYIGAGTSGRLGVLDASECPPTFSVPADLVQGLIAGGDRALRIASEHAEDSYEEGAQDLRNANFAAPGSDGQPRPDTLVGIAASGRTPYVLGALNYARSQGALTIGLSCVPNSAVAQTADIAISPNTGAEVLTGSTRLKAGTATKLALNMISTGVMVRTGFTFGNLMVNVQPTNAKLVDRAERIITQATSCDRPTATNLLREAGMSVKTAILMHRLHLTRPEAQKRLDQAKGVLRTALAQQPTPIH